jgi:hypothetical protein
MADKETEMIKCSHCKKWNDQEKIKKYNFKDGNKFFGTIFKADNLDKRLELCPLCVEKLNNGKIKV